MRLCNYPHFQSSAARSQPSDRFWCKRLLYFLQTRVHSGFFQDSSIRMNVNSACKMC